MGTAGMRAVQKPSKAQIKLRLPEWLHRKVTHDAQESGRSLNNEIVWRLERTYLAEQGDIAGQLASLSARVEVLEARLAAESMSPDLRAKIMEVLEKGRKAPKAE
jgi:hypothetical protein